MQCLNLGCGDRYHPDWTNINFTSTGGGVIAHNLKQGIPFPDESFDVVYHSHVLELKILSLRLKKKLFLQSLNLKIWDLASLLW